MGGMLSLAASMSTHNVSNTEETTSAREIPPWAQGESLRKVEKDVLIPRIMRDRSKILCADFVEAFAACGKGRTLSMVWACRKQNSEMKSCLTKYYQDPKFFEECKEIYLKDRENFQHEWQETGHTKKMKKKDVLI